MTLFPGHALITGAASGIGRQIAIAFAAEGCRSISILDRDEAGLAESKRLVEKAASEGGAVTVLAIEVDIARKDEVVISMQQTIQKFGRIDYAVNCAGIFGTGHPTHDQGVEEFDNIMSINLRGLWLCAKEELKQMMGQEPLPTHDGRPGSRGSIVNMASNLALVGVSGQAAYSASKCAIVGMTRTDAIDYSAHNIRVNCVCPGIIDTPLTELIGNDSDAVKVAPAKRKGTPQEVADVVLFMSSPKASFMQGSAVTVDGGYILA